MRQILFSVLTALGLTLALAVTPVAAQAAAFPSTIIRNNGVVSPPRCIGPLNGATADNTPVVLTECTPVWNGFAPVAVSIDNSIRHSSGKCLSLSGNRLVLRTCAVGVTPDQQWTFRAVTPGAPDNVWILGQHFNFNCVTPDGNNTAIGTQLRIQSCNFGPLQKWVLPPNPGSFGFSFDDGTTP
ncbi:RICIN domain-containing protein [Nonomuraea rhizosphaerae]|uniref:RICIN domain-containing protein n=1 Tax=Nonomuraea rhizosphaerae TaxID=2665663 RepID=UPI001C5CD4CD|nr:RICIN domain-containing protein [Nonomuraea rhizosphaerae]